MDGKIVLVTGAANGLGREIATAFAEKGATLFLVDLAADQLGDVERSLRDKGIPVTAVTADLSTEQGIAECAESFASTHDQLDVLVNNAGFAYGEIATDFFGLGMEKWQKFLALNTVAPLLIAEALRPQLAAANGLVINQSSMASYVPGTCYGVTKAALNAVTFGMASQLGGDGIRCVALAPGLMETQANRDALNDETTARLIGMQASPKRPGKPRDIANMALFLASDEGSFVNNTVLSVDAGNQIRGWRC